MIKCPKCSFEQPEDIYCANCGVNMKTYRATPVPVYKVILSSWITKIAVLTLLIIGAVIYDYQRRSEKNEPIAVGDKLKGQYTRVAGDTSPTPPPAPEPAPMPKPSPFSAKGSSSGEGLAAAVAKAPTPPPPAANKGGGGKPILRVTFYEGSRAAIQELQRESQGGSSSGDISGGVTPAKRLQALVNAGEMKSLSSNRYQEYDAQNPVIIFKGQRSRDPSKNLGLYFQITPLRQEAGSLQMEVKSWGNVRLQDPDDSLFTSEMTLIPQSSAFVAGFLPKDKAFSDDEKAFFESDAILKIYNDEEFTDGSSDLIMVIEMTPAP